MLQIILSRAATLAMYTLFVESDVRSVQPTGIVEVAAISGACKNAGTSVACNALVYSLAMRLSAKLVSTHSIYSVSDSNGVADGAESTSWSFKVAGMAAVSHPHQRCSSG